MQQYDWGKVGKDSTVAQVHCLPAATSFQSVLFLSIHTHVWDSSGETSAPTTVGVARPFSRSPLGAAEARGATAQASLELNSLPRFVNVEFETVWSGVACWVQRELTVRVAMPSGDGPRSLRPPETRRSSSMRPPRTLNSGWGHTPRLLRASPLPMVTPTPTPSPRPIPVLAPSPPGLHPL